MSGLCVVRSDDRGPRWVTRIGSQTEKCCLSTIGSHGVSRSSDRPIAILRLLSLPTSSQRNTFWTGGLETAGPGCYDAAAIARAAGFRMLVMSRINHAAIVP